MHGHLAEPDFDTNPDYSSSVMLDPELSMQLTPFGICTNKEQQNFYKTKTLQLGTYSDGIDDSLWHQFVIKLNFNLLSYHECEDIILFSSPYAIEEITNSLNQSLKSLNLLCVYQIITDYLFDIPTKLDSISTMSKDSFQRLIQQMSVIIIDTKSEQMITIPLHSSDLSKNNSNINGYSVPVFASSSEQLPAHLWIGDDQLCDIDVWKMRWSIDVANSTVNFQKIMNDICDLIINDENMMKEFVIYCSHGKGMSGSIWEIKEDLSYQDQELQRLNDLIAKMSNDETAANGNINEDGFKQTKESLERAVNELYVVRQSILRHLQPVTFDCV